MVYRWLHAVFSSTYSSSKKEISIYDMKQLTSDFSSTSSSEFISGEMLLVMTVNLSVFVFSATKTRLLLRFTSFTPSKQAHSEQDTKMEEH